MASADANDREYVSNDEDELGSLGNIVDVDALSDSAPPVVLLEEFEAVLED